MSTHALYVIAAYGVTVLALGALIGWLAIDLRQRRRELAELEAGGVRRGSDRDGPIS